MKRIFSLILLLLQLLPVSVTAEEVLNDSLTRACNNSCSSSCINYKKSKAFCNLITKQLQVENSGFIHNTTTGTVRDLGNLFIDGNLIIQGLLFFNGLELNTNSLTEWAYITNTATRNVAAGADVILDNNIILTAGISHTPGTATITINSAGTYLAIYSITSPTLQTAIGLTLDNTIVPRTTYYRAITGLESIRDLGYAIITPTAGQVLTIRNVGPAAFIIDANTVVTDAIDASIVLIKIA